MSSPAEIDQAKHHVTLRLPKLIRSQGELKLPYPRRSYVLIERRKPGL
ncbi:hypothetical protein Mcup_1321 [Metallosphaera cuprina Ar-4]|uniref:Uncharacterized protein n=1 Tax=Metallosphaera cuprina (strain Ar-4) TaxID=1006006 RepID=F4FY51_METCR|nr:hypothetical protein Mcup_1321 [Metallosphaera cuprina Ar-4]